MPPPLPRSLPSGLPLAAVRKKRKLYRQLTGSEVPWFPHDNDIDFVKELVHEARNPRWVYFGTPAGGAGISGVIEMGCSVMALCFNEHHRKHLGPFLLQRAVEAMVGSDSVVFKNETLCARAKQLKLTKDETKEDKKEDEKDVKKEEKKDDKKEDKTEEKKEGKNGRKTKKKKNDGLSTQSLVTTPTFTITTTSHLPPHLPPPHPC